MVGYKIQLYTHIIPYSTADSLTRRWYYIMIGSRKPILNRYSSAAPLHDYARY
jgi:hypothetical protein